MLNTRSLNYMTSDGQQFAWEFEFRGDRITVVVARSLFTAERPLQRGTPFPLSGAEIA